MFNIRRGRWFGTADAEHNAWLFSHGVINRQTIRRTRTAVRYLCNDLTDCTPPPSRCCCNAYHCTRAIRKALQGHYPGYQHDDPGLNATEDIDNYANISVEPDQTTNEEIDINANISEDPEQNNIEEMDINANIPGEAILSSPILNANTPDNAPPPRSSRRLVRSRKVHEPTDDAVFSSPSGSSILVRSREVGDPTDDLFNSPPSGSKKVVRSRKDSSPSGSKKVVRSRKDSSPSGSKKVVRSRKDSPPSGSKKMERSRKDSSPSGSKKVVRSRKDRYPKKSAIIPSPGGSRRSVKSREVLDPKDDNSVIGSPLSIIQEVEIEAGPDSQPELSEIPPENMKDKEKAGGDYETGRSTETYSAISEDPTQVEIEKNTELEKQIGILEVPPENIEEPEEMGGDLESARNIETQPEIPEFSQDVEIEEDIELQETQPDIPEVPRENIEKTEEIGEDQRNIITQSGISDIPQKVEIQAATELGIQPEISEVLSKKEGGRIEGRRKKEKNKEKKEVRDDRRSKNNTETQDSIQPGEDTAGRDDGTIGGSAESMLGFSITRADNSVEKMRGTTRRMSRIFDSEEFPDMIDRTSSASPESKCRAVLHRMASESPVYEKQTDNVDLRFTAEIARSKILLPYREAKAISEYFDENSSDSIKEIDRQRKSTALGGESIGFRGIIIDTIYNKQIEDPKERFERLQREPDCQIEKDVLIEALDQSLEAPYYAPLHASTPLTETGPTDIFSRRESVVSTIIAEAEHRAEIPEELIQAGDAHDFKMDEALIDTNDKTSEEEIGDAKSKDENLDEMDFFDTIDSTHGNCTSRESDEVVNASKKGANQDRGVDADIVENVAGGAESSETGKNGTSEGGPTKRRSKQASGADEGIAGNAAGADDAETGNGGSGSSGDGSEGLSGSPGDYYVEGIARKITKGHCRIRFRKGLMGDFVVSKRNACYFVSEIYRPLNDSEGSHS